MKYQWLEDTARYAGLLLAPAEGFGLQPRHFFAFRAKNDLIMLLWPIFGFFWCPVVTLVTLSSNLKNLVWNSLKSKIIKKKPKISKINKKIKKSMKSYNEIQKNHLKKNQKSKNCQKWSKINISQKKIKNHFFSKIWKFWKYFFFTKKMLFF